MANINISIPDDVHKDLKVAAVMQGNSLKTLIIKTLEQYAEGKSSISRSKKKSTLGVKK